MEEDIEKVNEDPDRDDATQPVFENHRLKASRSLRRRRLPRRKTRRPRAERASPSRAPPPSTRLSLSLWEKQAPCHDWRGHSHALFSEHTRHSLQSEGKRSFRVEESRSPVLPAPTLACPFTSQDFVAICRNPGGLTRRIRLWTAMARYVPVRFPRMLRLRSNARRGARSSADL
jgi:hypothetical protein